MYDCGFTKGNDWFRYRVGAIIIEEMHWIPIKDLDKYKAFPSFMKEYLSTEHCGIEHIITDERI